MKINENKRISRNYIVASFIIHSFILGALLPGLNSEQESIRVYLRPPESEVHSSDDSGRDSSDLAYIRTSELETKIEDSSSTSSTSDRDVDSLVSNNINLRFYKGAKHNLHGDNPYSSLMAKGLIVFMSQALSYDPNDNDDNLGITYFMGSGKRLEEHLFFDDREIAMGSGFFRKSGEQIPFEHMIGMKPEQLGKGAHLLRYTALDIEGEKIEGTAILYMQ